jgi:phenylacetate-CoA ligase
MKFLQSNFVQRYLEKYKLLKLKKTLNHVYENTRFYHDLFKKHNITPKDIKSYEDFSKIPFTTSKDIKSPEQFFAVPKREFTKVFSSSGTTGKPKRIYFTRSDLNHQISGIKTGLQLLYNITFEDVCRITYDHGYGIDDWGVRYCMGHAVDQIGAMSLFTQARLPITKEKKMLSLYDVSVLMGTPSYLNSLTYELEKTTKVADFQIKTILVGTEPLPSAVRSYLEETWKTKVYQGYGMTEMGTSVAGECSIQNGMHVTESDFYPEIIHPKTGELLPPGEEGELVFTTLSRVGMPILRYKTHDLGYIMKDPCPCGLPFSRIKITGRTDKMLTIGSGDNLYPSSFENVLFPLPFVINYQIILTRKDNKDHIEVIVESDATQEKYKKQVVEAMLSLPEICDGITKSKTIHPVKVTFVKPHTLHKNRVKAERLIDKRHLFS